MTTEGATNVMVDNPINNVWYSTSDDPLPGSPCYGCRRGLRRSFHVHDDRVLTQFHLVRPRLTVDCVGLSYRLDRLLEQT